MFYDKDARIKSIFIDKQKFFVIQSIGVTLKFNIVCDNRNMTEIERNFLLSRYTRSGISYILCKYFMMNHDFLLKTCLCN